MKSVFLTAFTLLGLTSFAQRIENFYDWQWKPVAANEARFYSLMEQKDSVWHRRDYYLRERMLQMDGSYKDSACKIAHGPFQYYHANEVLKSKGTYVNGKKQGLWVGYHDNRMMSDSAFYEGGNPVGLAMEWHRSGYAADSSLWNADGGGVQVSWFENGSPSAAGFYGPGRKARGKWQFFHANGALSALEVYDGELLLSKEYFDESGNKLADTTNKDRSADFQGGDAAWVKYLNKNLYFPSHMKFTEPGKAVVVIGFAIDEEGKVTDAYVETSLHPEMDKAAMNVIRKSPRWHPAINHNRRVKAYRRQPVTFSQDW